MNYDEFMSGKLDALRDDGNYRVFADLERQRGNFPRATRHDADGTTSEVTVWLNEGEPIEYLAISTPNEQLPESLNHGQTRHALRLLRMRHRDWQVVGSVRWMRRVEHDPRRSPAGRRAGQDSAWIGARPDRSPW